MNMTIKHHFAVLVPKSLEQGNKFQLLLIASQNFCLGRYDFLQCVCLYLSGQRMLTPFS